MTMTKNSLKKTILALLLTGSLSGHVLGQVNRLRYADRQYELNNYRLAADEYAKIYSDEPGYFVAKKAAQSLDKIYAYSESYEWWKKTVGYGEAVKEDYASLLRSGYRSVENYDPSSDLKGSRYKAGSFEEFARPVINTQTSYRVYELKAMGELNSNASDYSLSGSKSGIQFFASNKGEGGQTKKSGLRLDAIGGSFGKMFYKSDGKNYYGIYTKNSDGKLIRVQVEGFELYHLSDPRLLSDGKMVFTATPNRLNRRDEVVYPGVFYGTYDAANFKVSEVKAFPHNRTNEYSVVNSGVDEEQRRLYFSSNRPGGVGGYDLYYVTYDGNMVFSEPVNLGPGINSVSNERDAFRLGDEFYFSSDRKGGFGGLDVYWARIQDNVFTEVSNMGQPVNSTADDFCFSIQSGTGGYLSSNRAGGKGYDDLYSVGWSDRSVKVYVVDASGNSLKEGTNLQLIDGVKGVDITATDEKGLVEMTEKGGTYTFAASRPGYFNQTVTATLAKDREEVTLVMVPIPYGLEVYKEIIYYDLDKDNLRELSKEKLNELSVFMLKHPELNLRIESHTDSRATDYYNQRLSERRAASVIKYLQGKGVLSARVSSAWFSEAKLVNDCGDGVPCPEDNHQLNRRSELKLIAFPDRNKSYELPEGASTADFESAEIVRNWFSKQYKGMK